VLTRKLIPIEAVRLLGILVSFSIVIGLCSYSGSAFGFKPSNSEPNANPSTPNAGPSTDAQKSQLTSNSSSSALFDKSPSGSVLSSLKMETYNNQDLGLNLQYPANWKVKELKNGVQIIKQEKANYLELRDHGTATKDLKEYVQDHISSRSESRTDFKIQSTSDKERLGTVPAHMIIYTFSGSGDRQMEKVLRYWLIVNGKEYTVAYISNIDLYESNLPAAKAVISSIHFR